MEDSNTSPYPSGIAHRSFSALIVDDELDICYLLRQILVKHNISVIRAGSIREACELLETHQPFDVIFLDNHLPDGMGVDFAAIIKQRFPGIKLIMITAHDSDSDRNMARKNGVDIFIPKPFSRELIAAAISS